MVGEAAPDWSLWHREGCGRAGAGKPPAPSHSEMCFLDENPRQLCEPTQCLFGSEYIPVLLSLPETCCGHTHHILPGEKPRCSTQQQPGRKSIPSPQGRAMGRGHVAQGVPRMEPGWLLGCHPAGGKRVLMEGPVGLFLLCRRGRVLEITTAASEGCQLKAH